ncbi:hypothetical protein F4814DRAFT_269116 [Daldinia grandis]|nr:hypothetical protein F4814DRAFT_269116 [Daldinia grandis]
MGWTTMKFRQSLSWRVVFVYLCAQFPVSSFQFPVSSFQFPVSTRRALESEIVMLFSLAVIVVHQGPKGVNNDTA